MNKAKNIKRYIRLRRLDNPSGNRIITFGEIRSRFIKSFGTSQSAGSSQIKACKPFSKIVYTFLILIVCIEFLKNKSF